MNVYDAFKVGNLDWIKEHHTAGTLPNSMPICGFYCHELAAFFGHLHILEWLVNERSLPVDLTSHNNRAVRLAVERGHLPVVKWLIEKSGQPVDVTALNGAALQSAMLNEHLPVIKWLVEESGCLKFYSSSVEIVEWLKKRATIS